MSHKKHSKSHSNEQGVAGALFADRDVDEFHAEDRKTAAAIVVLMTGIFVLGVVGYAIIAYWVAHA